jgi:phage baseplate assembly protein V
VKRLWQRVNNMFAHGKVTAVNDAGGVQKHQLQLGYMETRDNTPSLQHFGLASTPPIGSDAVLIFFAGDRSQGLVVGTNNQGVRPVNQGSGETTLYNAYGMTVALSAAGISINTGGLPMVINGDLHVTGEVIRGFGGAVQVTLGLHHHGTGVAAAGTSAPSPGT